MKTFLKQILRQLKSDKINTTISISGLIIGFGVICSVLFFVTRELSYNHQFTNGTRIYRILNYDKNNRQTWANTPFILGETIKQNFAETENIFHLYSMKDIQVKTLNHPISKEEIFSTESSFFSALDIPIINGTLQYFDIDKNTIAIDASTAMKYFGNTDVIGKTLTLEFNNKETEMNIVAVFNDVPENSDFHSTLIINIPTGLEYLSARMISVGVKPNDKMIMQDWTGSFYTNFLLVNNQVDIPSFERKIQALGQNHSTPEQNFNLSLQPLSDIYFNSQSIIDSNTTNSGNLPLLFIVLSVGILILFIAWANYINLALSNSLFHMKNKAIERICGAPTTKLFLQPIIKALIIAIISIPFALYLSKIGIKFINELTNSNCSFTWNKNFAYSILILFLITILSSTVSGSAIALKMSKISIIPTLKGNAKFHKQRTMKSLVVFQLTIFIALFASLLLIEKQVHYVFSKDMGFNKEGLVSVSLNDNDPDLFKQKILKNPDIINAAGTMWMPPTENRMFMSIPRVDEPDQKASLLALYADYDFIKTMDIQLIEGSTSQMDNSNAQVLVNESAIKELGLTTCLGEQTALGVITGVFKDFNMGSLHNKIQPTIIGLKKKMGGCMAIRIQTENIPSTLLFLEKTWKDCDFKTPFNYSFTNEILNNLYKKDLNFSKLIRLLTSIAIFLSIIGLIGLSLLVGKQKRKEIGIRKVNGAKTGELIMMLNLDFIKSAIAAFIVALPLSWFGIHKWLESFAYKTEMSWWIFALAGSISVIIVIVAVSWQSWLTAVQNPVEALRNE